MPSITAAVDGQPRYTPTDRLKRYPGEESSQAIADHGNTNGLGVFQGQPPATTLLGSRKPARNNNHGDAHQGRYFCG